MEGARRGDVAAKRSAGELFLYKSQSSAVSVESRRRTMQGTISRRGSLRSAVKISSQSSRPVVSADEWEYCMKAQH